MRTQHCPECLIICVKHLTPRSTSPWIKKGLLAEFSFSGLHSHSTDCAHVLSFLKLPNELCETLTISMKVWIYLLHRSATKPLFLPSATSLLKCWLTPPLTQLCALSIGSMRSGEVWLLVAEMATRCCLNLVKLCHNLRRMAARLYISLHLQPLPYCHLLWLVHTSCSQLLT